MRLLLLTPVALFLASAHSLAQAIELDKKLPTYRPVQGVSGSVKSVGSDTMNNLLTLWAEGFMKIYPNVRIEIEGKGSSTAPPALIAGTANFGPMSRPMKATEIDEFEEKYGYEPVPLRTSIDMLAVYVNKDNPIQSLTLQEVDAIFSKNRRGGSDKNARTWGHAGLGGRWSQQPLSLYGRNSASGTYGVFKEKALFRGDFKDSVKEQPGSSSVVQGIASDRYGIGYSGIGYRTADVRAVPLAKNAKSEAIAPTPANAYTNTYPLTRFLIVYMNREPNRELDPLRYEFVRYIFSRQGQEDVVKAGFYPVTFQLAQRAAAEAGVRIEAEVSSGD